MDNYSRRQVLQTMAAGGVLSALPANAGFAEQSAPTNAIQIENQQPGTRDWMLSRAKIDAPSKYRCPWIEGYASHSSIEAGESLQLFVSTTPATRFRIDLFRLGFYGGLGGRLVASLGEFEGREQPLPEPGPKRLIDCHWEATTSLVIPKDWCSGVYVGKLTLLDEGTDSYVIFVVKDRRPCDLVFQCSDHTWQAYNRWPTQFSLYDNGVEQWYWGHSVQVGFNRPYGKYCQILDAPLSTGSGEFFLWEFPFVYWIEQQGYDVSYIANGDTHHDVSFLSRAKGFLSVGHDEYWTRQMFDHAQIAIASGVSVGFFSGNAVCGRIQFGESGREFERVGVFGPPGGTHEFSHMKTLEHERPYANELVGAHSTGPVTGGADWVCTQPEHWIYEGTGFELGSRIPGVIGWEWHGDPAPLPGLEVIASDFTQSSPGTLNGGKYTATVYPGPKKNFVFNASTCWWADGLSQPPGYVRPQVYTAPQGPNPALQKITSNILNKMITGIS